VFLLADDGVVRNTISSKGTPFFNCFFGCGSAALCFIVHPLFSEPVIKINPLVRPIVEGWLQDFVKIDSTLVAENLADFVASRLSVLNPPYSGIKNKVSEVILALSIVGFLSITSWYLAARFCNVAALPKISRALFSKTPTSSFLRRPRAQ